MGLLCANRQTPDVRPERLRPKIAISHATFEMGTYVSPRALDHRLERFVIDTRSCRQMRTRNGSCRRDASTIDYRVGTHV